jgi:hypothetical protein
MNLIEDERPVIFGPRVAMPQNALLIEAGNYRLAPLVLSARSRSINSAVG